MSAPSRARATLTVPASSAAASSAAAAKPVAPWRWCDCLEHHPFHTELCLFALDQIAPCLASRQAEAPSQVRQDELSSEPLQQLELEPLSQRSDDMEQEDEEAMTPPLSRMSRGTLQ